jgi:hypothetical protein
VWVWVQELGCLCLSRMLVLDVRVSRGLGGVRPFVLVVIVIGFIVGPLRGAVATPHIHILCLCCLYIWFDLWVDEMMVAGLVVVL